MLYPLGGTSGLYLQPTLPGRQQAERVATDTTGLSGPLQQRAIEPVCLRRMHLCIGLQDRREFRPVAEVCC